VKKIRIIAIITAIVLAISVLIFLRSLNEPEEVEKTLVVIAANNILPHTEITSDMIATKEIPADVVHNDAALSKDLVIGKVCNSHIVQDEIILLSKLEKPGESTYGLSYAVQEGMRAITVSVDEVSGLSGLLQPGNYVDVLIVLTIEKEIMSHDEDKTVSNTIQETLSSQLLQNIEILAVGSYLDERIVSSEENQYQTVTLSVSPEQALDLILAEELGQIRLTLRSPLDTETPTIEPVVVDKLYDNKYLNKIIEEYKNGN
jgi:pilus assembly protein CpaB